MSGTSASKCTPVGGWRGHGGSEEMGPRSIIWGRPLVWTKLDCPKNLDVAKHFHGTDERCKGTKSGFGPRRVCAGKFQPERQASWCRAVGISRRAGPVPLGKRADGASKTLDVAKPSGGSAEVPKLDPDATCLPWGVRTGYSFDTNSQVGTCRP